MSKAFVKNVFIRIPKIALARRLLRPLFSACIMLAILFVSSASAAEKLPNGSFDTGTNCGATIDNWTFTDSGPPVLAGQTSGMQAGDCALRYYVDLNDPSTGHAETTFTYDQNDAIATAAITYWRKSTPYSVNNCTNIVTLVDPASVERTIDSRTCTSSSTWGQITAGNTTAVKTALEAYNGTGTAWKLRMKWTIDDTNPTGLFVDTIVFDVTLSDTTAPTTTLSTVPISADGNNGWFKTMPAISLSRDESGTTYYKWEDAGGYTSNTSTPISVAGREGIHNLSYYSIDTATNRETTRDTGISVDTVAPTGPALSSSSHTTTDASKDTTVDINLGTSSDATSGVDGFSYSWDTSATTTPDTVKDAEQSISSLTSPALNNGTANYLHFRTVDNAGNWSTTSHLGPFTIDTQAPTSTLNVAAPDGTSSWYKSVPSIQVTSNESGVKQYQWNSTTDAWSNYSTPFNAPAGINTLYYRSIDNPGNTEDIRFQEFRVDTGVPVSTITSPPDGARINASTVTITGTANDTGASGLYVVQVQIDSGDWYDMVGTTSWSVDWGTSGEGAHTIRSRAVDAAGNVQSPVASIGVTVDHVAPEVSSTVPISGASEVAVTSDLTATFNEEMSADTITASTFTLESVTGDPVAGAVSYDAPTRTATFNPSSSLRGTSYTARVTTGAKDVTGNGLSSTYSWSFSTAGAPDVLPPITTLSALPASADGLNSWFITAPSITLTPNESATPYYQWGATLDGSWSAYGSPFSPAAGQNTVYYRSVDVAGNTEDIRSATFYVDLMTPDAVTGIASTSHTTGDATSDATVDMQWSSATDAHSGISGYSIEWNQSAVSTPDTSIDLGSGVTTATSPVLSSGSNYFHIRTRDAAGHWSSSSHSGPYVVEPAPVTSISISPSVPDGTNGWYKNRPAITLTANKAGTIQYQWDASSDAGWSTYSAPVYPLNGSHVIWYRTIDAGGATGDAGSETVKLDDPAYGGENPTDPTNVTSTSHTVGQLSRGLTIDVTWTPGSDATSGLDGYAIAWSSEGNTVPARALDLEQGATSATSPTLTTGRYYFHISTKDNAGNWTSTVHVGPFDVVGTELAVGPHGGFSSSTSKCKNCHRPHQAPGYRLMFAREGTYSTLAGFCFTCHKDGSGANADVYNGVFRGDRTGTQDAAGDPLFSIENTSYYGEAGAGLNGGGFVTARPYTGVGGRHGATADVTSRHDVYGVPGVSPDNVTMWGSNSNGPGDSVAPLWCVSCHIPHGSTNYRLLRDKLNPSSGGRSFPPSTVKSHEMSFDTNPDTGNLLRSYTTTSYQEGIVRFCTSCHLQYSKSKGRIDGASETYNSGDGFGSIVRYRHPVDVALSSWTWPGKDNWGNLNGNITASLNDPDHTMVPLEQTSYSTRAQASDKVVCLTCHQAHGTSAATVTADSRAGPTTTAYSSGPGYSNLLRLSYRGVCENCHEWYHSPADSNAE